MQFFGYKDMNIPDNIILPDNLIREFEETVLSTLDHTDSVLISNQYLVKLMESTVVLTETLQNDLKNSMRQFKTRFITISDPVHAITTQKNVNNAASLYQKQIKELILLSTPLIVGDHNLNHNDESKILTVNDGSKMIQRNSEVCCNDTSIIQDKSNSSEIIMNASEASNQPASIVRSEICMQIESDNKEKGVIFGAEIHNYSEYQVTFENDCASIAPIMIDQASCPKENDDNTCNEISKESLN